MTRFERIKSMTIDELAKEIDKIGAFVEICKEKSSCPYMDEDGDISNDCNCCGCIKEWLTEEASEE